jgi:hypothetical protein
LLLPFLQSLFLLLPFLFLFILHFFFLPFPGVGAKGVVSGARAVRLCRRVGGGQSCFSGEVAFKIMVASLFYKRFCFGDFVGGFFVTLVEKNWQRRRRMKMLSFENRYF